MNDKITASVQTLWRVEAVGNNPPPDPAGFWHRNRAQAERQMTRLMNDGGTELDLDVAPQYQLAKYRATCVFERLDQPGSTGELDLEADE